MVGRILNPLKTRSYFLFGPRGSGKSTFLERAYDPQTTLFVDLLDPHLLDEFRLDSSRFTALVGQKENLHKIVVVDEVQKLPALLDQVHLLIFKKKRRFVLTGSSARKLKQQGVNLLAGRASVYHLYPLCSRELGADFDLTRALEWGLLPESYLAESPEERKEYLSAYVLTYLEKEIQQEQWVRRIEPFRVFLAIAAQMNGKIINYSKIAREVGVDDVTVRSYFEILEDTLLGFFLPAFHHSIRKAQKQAPKFYLIDPGIKRALDKTLIVPLLPQTNSYGDAFEHWFILELIKLASYKRNDWQFAYLMTKDDLEIDLVVTRPAQPLLLIEIKSKHKIDASDAKALNSLAPDLDLNAECVLVSNDPLEQVFGGTTAMHWSAAIERWFGK